MTRREPTTAEIRRLLAPERHTTSREDATMPHDRAETIDVGPVTVGTPLERTGTDAGILEDAAAVLQLLDQASIEPSTDQATLSMPLGRLIDADGKETILGLGYVHVQIFPAGLLAALSGETSAEDDAPVTLAVARELTPEGADAIRTLAALLPQDGGE